MLSILKHAHFDADNDYVDRFDNKSMKGLIKT